jgi:hydroxymethylbilane synthase
VKSIRGNVDTRIRKVDEGLYDVAVMAGAGLTRLSLEKHIACWLDFSDMLPAPGQGALGIQCRSDDKETLQILNTINDPDTNKSVTAERAFLQALGGGCSIPVGAFAEIKDGDIYIQGLVASVDGSRIIEVSAIGKDPLQVGEELAEHAISQGAKEILYG